jgi:multisubunit Na+/H+ antiporter MnhE subunit
MNITINHILYFITVLAILAYLLKINRAIYYFIMSSMTVVFYLVSNELTMSICISGVITALIYVFLDRQPLKKRKSINMLKLLVTKIVTEMLCI